MFVSHVWPARLLPPEAIQTGEVCQRGCQTDRRFLLLSCIFFFIAFFLFDHILCFPRLLLFHLPTTLFLLMLQLSLSCWQVFGRKLRRYLLWIRVSFTTFSKKRCHTSVDTGENIFGTGGTGFPKYCIYFLNTRVVFKRKIFLLYVNILQKYNLHK